jgi:hypothetical protein
MLSIGWRLSAHDADFAVKYGHFRYLSENVVTLPAASRWGEY